MRGRVEPIGYTTFSRGGHGVLFTDEHHLSARYGGSTAFGLSARAQVHMPVGSRLAIVAGWRLFVPQLMALAVTVGGLAASDEGIEQLQWDDCAAHLGAGARAVAADHIRCDCRIRRALLGERRL